LTKRGKSKGGGYETYLRPTQLLRIQLHRMLLPLHCPCLGRLLHGMCRSVMLQPGVAHVLGMAHRHGVERRWAGGGSEKVAPGVHWLLRVVRVPLLLLLLPGICYHRTAGFHACWSWEEGE